jgi:hypothetical protein
LDCGAHAREWLSHMFCIRLIEELAKGVDEDFNPAYTFFVIPVRVTIEMGFKL